MAARLKGKKIAFLVADGFEQIELTEPMKAVRGEGAEAVLVSPASGEVQGMNHDEKGSRFPVDLPVARANPDDFDALVLPGGVMNPDQLRQSEEAVRFVRTFFAGGKPVAAICHGPWTLIEADVVRDRTVTSYPSLKTDLRNAGARWVDEEVVVDDGLVTSRGPRDIPAFCAKLVEEVEEGVHRERRVKARPQEPGAHP